MRNKIDLRRSHMTLCAPLLFPPISLSLSLSLYFIPFSHSLCLSLSLIYPCHLLFSLCFYRIVSLSHTHTLYLTLSLSLSSSLAYLPPFLPPSFPLSRFVSPLLAFSPSPSLFLAFPSIQVCVRALFFLLLSLHVCTSCMHDLDLYVCTCTYIYTYI